MGEVLEVAKVLVEPTMKLLDMVGGAIGTAYEPRHKRKMADATAYEIKAIGEAMRNNSDVIIVYEQGNVLAKSPEFKEFVERTQHRLAYQELLKQKNIESILDNAFDELSDTPVVSDEPLDNDWISSFFNFVENISSEQMQVIWGKLLAGEVRQPRSFSIRTLDVLRKMTQHEANLFHRISPYILSCTGNKEKTTTDYFVFAELVNDSFEDDIMRYPNIHMLSEAGLFSTGASVVISLQIKSGEVEIISGFNKKIELRNIGEECAEVSQGAYLLTEAGKELLNIMSIMDKEDGISNYFEKCAHILTSNEKFDFINRYTGQIECEIIE